MERKNIRICNYCAHHFYSGEYGLNRNLSLFSNTDLTFDCPLCEKTFYSSQYFKFNTERKFKIYWISLIDFNIMRKIIIEESREKLLKLILNG